MEIQLKNAVAIGLLAGFMLSLPLWISSRPYPLTPVVRFLKPTPFPFDYAVFFLLLLVLTLIIVAPRPAKLIAAFVCLAGGVALFDQSRWQPWFYQYLVLLAAVGLCFASGSDEEKRKSALDACRLAVVSTYFWSGVQKMNSGFAHTTFPWLLEPLLRFLPQAAKGWLSPFGFLAPFVEIGIAIGLLTTNFRSLAVIVAIGMHLFILASIGPLGHNWNNVIWPWNVAMCVFVVLLFWRAGEISPKEIIWGHRFAFQKLVLVLFGLAPALSLFSLWDDYLSFALYSGNTNDATIYVPVSSADRLPAGVQELASQYDQEFDRLTVADWSWGVLNVPPYPQIRIFKSVGRAICSDTGNPQDFQLIVRRKSLWFQPQRRLVYDCATLLE